MSELRHAAREMLLRRPVASRELVHDVDQDVQALTGVSLRCCKLVHSLDQAQFGLGETAYEVGNASNLGCETANGGFKPSEACFQPSEALLVLSRNSLEPGLGVQNELHGLFDVHPLILVESGQLSPSAIRLPSSLVAES